MTWRVLVKSLFAFDKSWARLAKSLQVLIHERRCDQNWFVNSRRVFHWSSTDHDFIFVLFIELVHRFTLLFLSKYHDLVNEKQLLDFFNPSNHNDPSIKNCKNHSLHEQIKQNWINILGFNVTCVENIFLKKMIVIQRLSFISISYNNSDYNVGYTVYLYLMIASFFSDAKALLWWEAMFRCSYAKLSRWKV